MTVDQAIAHPALTAAEMSERGVMLKPSPRSTASTMHRQRPPCSPQPSHPGRWLPKTGGWILLASMALSSVLALTAQAQGVYRVVGPDGRISFSDRPPLDATKKSSELKPAEGSADTDTGTSSSNALLPYQLRETAKRYPVTLYASKDCSPCNEARSHLQNRGIPFAERAIETESDVAALKQLSGQDGLPFATIGSQHLKGFNADSWNQYLSAAGYPAQPQLPAQYKAPAPIPLTTPAAKAAAAKPAPGEARRPAPAPRATPPGTPTADNPAGLRF